MAARLGVGAAALMLAFSVAATAQQAAPKQGGSPVGGPSWKADVQSAPSVSGVTLEPAQLDTVNRVSAYFNSLHNLRGTFVQTNPDKKRMKGRFYVQRPGRLRFEYNLPSKQLVVSDGSVLAIQDLDINTDDRIALDQTPFRILLRKDVDLVRDARILEVQEADDLIIVSLQDKSPDAPGRIRLFLSKTPELELREWVTTDAQGTDTRLEVSNLAKPDTLDAGLFKIISPSLRPQ